MKNILIVAALLLLIAGTALAGSEYDRCIKEEKALKAQEAGDCSGLKYLLNPSGCFVTRKTLKEYAYGKCKKIGVTENADFSAPKVIPEKKGSVSTINNISNAGGVAVKKTEPETALQEPTIEQLKEENARLKAENEQLKKTGK